jgi:putative FmdB family regulatory protein
MPIYAYRCASCGHAKDVLQKLSEDALTVCPACGAAAFSKQLTAAGFQLKGSGWYVTDFRDGNTGKKDAKPEGDGQAADAKSADGKPADGKAADKPATDSTPANAPASTSASNSAASNAPAPAPAAAAPAPAASKAAAPPPAANS